MVKYFLNLKITIIFFGVKFRIKMWTPKWVIYFIKYIWKNVLILKKLYEEIVKSNITYKIKMIK